MPRTGAGPARYGFAAWSVVTGPLPRRPSRTKRVTAMTSPLSPDDLNTLVAALFPEDTLTLEALEQRYPPRDLPAGAMVTRVGPSPTGFMHIGTLYVGLICERFAHQTGGRFFIRIEDTDRKREVEGAADFIFDAFDHFGVQYDEGGRHEGPYGPYTQSQRAFAYRAAVRHLLARGMAYPCFCTAEELDAQRALQQAQGARPGYYGKWAKWRDRPLSDVMEALAAGATPVIRFRSPGDIETKIEVDDLIYGRRTVAENDQDIVILKSEGLPTYHMAHVVDDHFMRTTHVIRGDEWLPSLPTHLQLFEALGWAPPAFAHIAPINKQDGGSKRKLSKRKDPEASVSYFVDLGYPTEALLEYLLNLANSNFEDWRRDHPAADYRDFVLSMEKLANSNGPLFDFVKLDNISRDVVARLSTPELRDRVITWARDHDPEFAARLEAEPDYSLRFLGIEREGPKVRKDIARWSDVRGEVDFFFDSVFDQTPLSLEAVADRLTPDDVRQLAQAFMATYDEGDGSEAWFDKIKAIARDHGFAEKAGDYKRNPEQYKGTVADVAKVYRVLLAGRPQTPDLYSVIQAMGRERVFARMSRAL